MIHLSAFTTQIADLALVPTMGALHEGHISLIKKAKTLATNVLVSVYVNPTQFNSKDDLEKYPKTLAKDLRLAETAGADFLWTPKFAEIYPEGLDNVQLISAGSIGSLFEGVARPHHFSGVLTVIDRLFSIVKPKSAIFGEKDFQQLFLIRKFTGVKYSNIEIISGETIRDSDGIALSSRNAQLNQEQIKNLQIFPRAKSRIQNLSSLGEIKSALGQHFDSAPDGALKLDYLAIVDPVTLEEVDLAYKGTIQVLLAGWIGSVRVIDNFSHKIGEG